MANARVKSGIFYQIDRESLLLDYGSVNKAFLLKRGWTRTAIKRILGEPDRRITMRAHRKDRPECRYDVRRVLAAEEAGKIRFRRAPEEPDEADPAEEGTVVANCLYCWERLTYERSAVGRPRKYCSTRCRSGAAREMRRGKKGLGNDAQIQLVTTIDK
jgi:hypothetical protein